MIYRELGRSGLRVSALALGGHEFLPDGRSRGFNEDSKLAVTPGHLFPGFGGEQRRAVVRAALDAGICFFDATIDSEKEALGRNLPACGAGPDVVIQTRPEGMAYGYDECNRKMARQNLLLAEVQRVLGLLQRERIDILNLPFMQAALDDDPDYLAKITDNIAVLQEQGLIRAACADTFSGQAVYLAQIATGSFDSLFLNFNVADDAALDAVLPAALEAGMGVTVREPFGKGTLFAAAEEVGLTDRGAVARTALKWCLGQPGVTAVAMGVDSPEMLRANVVAVDQPALSDEEQELLGRLRTAPRFLTTRKAKRERFLGTAG